LPHADAVSLKSRAPVTFGARVLEQPEVTAVERYVDNVLLFNGVPGCDDYLGPVAAMMTGACQVIRFEPRGCARSTWDGNYDPLTTLGDAEAIRAAHGIERWMAGAQH
jgi:pimeloyl-ACP methyl ester carboxylesterase